MMNNLDGLAGTWAGTKKLWLKDPDRPDSSDVALEVGPNGIAYSWRFRGEPQAGSISLAADQAALEVSWTDSWHSPSPMLCRGEAGDDGLSVLGTYPAGDGSPDWSWRISLSQPAEGELTILMFNIPPGADEIPAVEIACRRA